MRFSTLGAVFVVVCSAMAAGACDRRSTYAPTPAPSASSAALSVARRAAPTVGPTNARDDARSIVITDPAQREAAVGRPVTVVGTQTPTKIPTVVGIDVDGDYNLSDRRVRAIGILHKRVVERSEHDNAVAAATRGPGTYYYLVDRDTGRLARPTAE